MRRRPSLLALAGGILLAAGTPPWGFWPLAFAGLVLLERAVAARTTGGGRFRAAWWCWAGLFFPSLLWMRALTLPGYVIASVAYAAFLAIGVAAAPRGQGRFLAIPAGIVFAEWVRWRWPFGGVPLSNLAVGQVAGPLAPMLRLGGALFVVLVTALVGMGLAAVVRRHVRLGSTILLAATAVLLVAAEAPDGTPTGVFLDVAAVQGGGPQGTRAVDTEPGIVFERHLAASASLRGDLDLILWPEDVVDVVTLTGSAEDRRLRQLAVDNGATFIAGVIEDEGSDHFRNWAIAYAPDGEEVDRYEKVERVPFGEWVPFRSLLERFAGDALPARDATIGQTPAVVDTPAGRFGVSISWEIFFGERTREAMNHDAELLLNPTNGSSFTGTQVQTQQVANSRMRAIESGRWVIQAAPTGFSAIIEPDGTVRQRTAVSERRILYDTVELRTGRTLYTRVGDLLAIGCAVALFAGGWAMERRSRSPHVDPA